MDGRRRSIPSSGVSGSRASAGRFPRLRQQLPEDRRQAVLDCYFGPDGLGYTLGRTYTGSCDFALGNYACQSGPEDEGSTPPQMTGT